jgi:ubiquinone biosynthesis protein
VPHATLGFAGRAATLAGYFLWHGLRWFLGWLGLLVTLAGRQRRQAWFGACVLALFRSLGATFIKVGQIMSTRPDLLPPHVIQALEKLQDQVGPFAWAHVERTLREDFGQGPDELYASFERTPIASASVAQVHRACLHGGRVVAVKVRRPDLEKIVGFDLAVMRGVAGILSLVPSARLLAPVEQIEEFGRAIHAQLDFRIEAHNNRRFHELFRGDPDVIFPVLVDALSSERVLTMEFIEGEKILRFASTPHDPSRLARLGFRTLLQMVFKDGFVHADLHPGNILLTNDDRVVLIDLGLVTEIPLDLRKPWIETFVALSQRDGAACARLFYGYAPSVGATRYAAFERDVVEFLGRLYGKNLGEVEVGDAVSGMMNILRRHQVQVDPSFTVVHVALLVAEGLGKMLDPGIDLVGLAAPYLMQAMISAPPGRSPNREPPAALPAAAA